MRNSVRFLGRTCIRGGSYENQRVWENQAAVLMRTNPINQWCFLKWQMAVFIRTSSGFSGRTSFKKHPSVLLQDHSSEPPWMVTAHMVTVHIVTQLVTTLVTPTSASQPCESCPCRRACPSCPSGRACPSSARARF